MEEISEAISKHWGTFVAFAGAVGVIATLMTNAKKISEYFAGCIKARKERRDAPQKTLALLQSMQGDIARIDTALTELSGKVEKIDADTGDLLCSQITREREYYIKLGFCPDSDKRRLADIHKRYKDRGRNHVSDTYVRDIEALPSTPTSMQVTIQ